MSHASASLQRAVFIALSNSSSVTALLGGARIHDDVPPQTAFPYVTFGQSQERDWSTGTESGGEHVLTLHVWSRQAGRRQVLEIIGALRAALHDRPMQLDGHRLVGLRHEFSETRRDPDGETWHGISRFRAITEPLEGSP
jgi:hypothetical protein